MASASNGLFMRTCSPMHCPCNLLPHACPDDHRTMHSQGEADGEDEDEDLPSDNGEASQASDDTNSHHKIQTRKRAAKQHSFNAGSQQQKQQQQQVVTAAPPQAKQAQAGYAEMLQEVAAGSNPTAVQQPTLASAFFPTSCALSSDQMGQIPVPPPPTLYAQSLLNAPPMPPPRSLPSVPLPSPSSSLPVPIPPQSMAPQQPPVQHKAVASGHVSEQPTAPGQHNMQRRGSQSFLPQAQPPQPPASASNLLSMQPTKDRRCSEPAPPAPQASMLPPQSHPLPPYMQPLPGAAGRVSGMSDLPSLPCIRTEAPPTGVLGASNKAGVGSTVPALGSDDMPSTAQAALGFLSSPLAASFDDEQLEADLRGILSELSQGLPTPSANGLEWAAAGGVPTPQSLRKLLRNTPDSIAHLCVGPFGDPFAPLPSGAAGAHFSVPPCGNGTMCASAQLPPVRCEMQCGHLIHVSQVFLAAHATCLAVALLHSLLRCAGRCAPNCIHAAGLFACLLLYPRPAGQQQAGQAHQQQHSA